MTDDVQPQEGQGGHPWDQYLESIPEDAREAASEAFRQMDANATRKFQEAAEYRKAWEPFETLGVKDRDPEVVGWALELADAAINNPQSFAEWYGRYAQEHGLQAANEAVQQAEQEVGYIDPAVQQLVERTIQQALNPIASQLSDVVEWRDTRTAEERKAEEMRNIRSQLDALKEKHPDEYDEDLIEMFIPRHMGDDPKNAVQKAFDDVIAVRAKAQRDWVTEKVNQPAAAISGGTVSGTPDPPPKGQALKWASEQALAQLRGARSA
jgi:hypothetical protein